MGFPGKALFLRGRSLYPGRDPLSYAQALRFDHVIIPRPLYDDSFVADALATFERVYLYDEPKAWRPGDWKESWDKAFKMAKRTGAHGIIVDPEHASLWDGEFSEADALMDAMWSGFHAALHVGLSTFPMHPLWKRWAKASEGSDMFGIVQLYSHQGFPRSKFIPTLNEWNGAWAGGAVPAVALAWHGADGEPMRSLDEYRGYLDVFASNTDGAAMWHNAYPPEADSEHGELIQSFMRKELPDVDEEGTKEKGSGAALLALLAALAIGTAGAIYLTTQ